MSKLLCKSKYPMCPKDAQPGGIHQLGINQLSPTQFAVGKTEVEIKSKRMKHKHKYNPQKLHDYLVTRLVPAVIRNNKFYLVDHHHLVRALYEALHDELGDKICVLVQVVWNASVVLDDVWEESRYKLRELFGEDAFDDTLDDVLQAYRQAMAVESK